MRILVVGGGGREHALVWRLARDPGVERVFAAPGNAGIAREATCVPVAASEFAGLLEVVEREGIDLTVVGPEGPLVSGLADELERRGHAVFGPSRAAARIEGSKAWAKDLCQRHGIPAARSRTFSEAGDALAHLDELGDGPVVVKADGLAAGKGVTVAADRAEAASAVRACLQDHAFGAAGARVLVEEFLEGPEVSAFALSDGQDVLPLTLAQDFKRVGDGDRGPNTGGMGAYSPLPWVTADVERVIWDRIVTGTVRAMAADGVAYHGLLYAGLILTADGPKVLEFNCRFGDPETQVVLPRLRSDLSELLAASASGELASMKALWADDACVTVVLASGGYPGDHITGLPIEGIAAAEATGALVFHSGTQERDGRVVTAGGRVLAVSAMGPTIVEARARAYEATQRISFEGAQYRSDVAAVAAGRGAT